jgi:hypothetical protein
MLLNEDAEEIYDERIRTKREDYLDETGQPQKKILKRINNTIPLPTPIDHTTSVFNIGTIYFSQPIPTRMACLFRPK